MIIYVLIGIGLIIGIIIGIYSTYFSGHSDQELIEDGKKARINLECAESVEEIDALKRELWALQHYVDAEDAEMSTHVLQRISEGCAILNHKLTIRPFLMETRAIVSDYLSQFNENYNPEDEISISRALVDVAANGKLQELIELLEQQINNINLRRQ